MVGGIFTRLRSPLRLFHDTRGVSAVEFALILPVMLIMYLGCNEVGNGLTIARKVTHVTSTLADLVAQSKTSISQAQIDNILKSAAAIMTPYSSSLLKIKISEFHVDANSKVHVVWSKAFNDTALPTDPNESDQTKNVTNLPIGVKTANTYLITAEVHYAFTPTVGYVITGTFDVHDQFYLSPRLSDGITGPS